MVGKLIQSTFVVAAHAANSPWGRPMDFSSNGKQVDYEWDYDYDIDNLPQNGTCSGLLHGESTCPIGSVCMSSESGIDFNIEGCLPCNTPMIGMISLDDCNMFESFEDYDTGTSYGHVNLAEMCYGQCLGRPELIPQNPDDDITTTESTTTETTTTTRPRSTTTPSTTSTGSSCAQFDFIHDFLNQTGPTHFQSIFTNEQDSFSRRPGRETHGLKRRKIQFTQWIDNVFVKMSKHLEKRSFINCFEANGKLFDGGMVISEEFDQCPMIEATTIDEYFENLLVFVDWFYADCGNGMSGKLAEKLHHRWNRINEIKSEVQAHIDNKNGRLRNLVQRNSKVHQG